MTDVDKLKVRAEVMRLIPVVATEGRKISDAFARQHKLHATDVDALGYIMLCEVQERPLSAGSLGTELGLTSGATTFLMKRLERAGLLERVRDSEDHRRVSIHMTKTGRTLAQIIYQPIRNMSTAVMNNFSTEELETVCRFLAATTAAMASYTAPRRWE